MFIMHLLVLITIFAVTLTTTAAAAARAFCLIATLQVFVEYLQNGALKISMRTSAFALDYRAMRREIHLVAHRFGH